MQFRDVIIVTFCDVNVVPLYDPKSQRMSHNYGIISQSFPKIKRYWRNVEILELSILRQFR